MRFLFILSLLLLNTFPSFADDLDCDKGFESLKKIRNVKEPWAELLIYFKKYIPKCDDGYYAEGTSDLIVHLIANWKDFSGLTKTHANNKTYFQYVIRNINATVDKQDLEIIIANVKNKCPKENINICQQIETATAQAIEEMTGK